MVSLFNTYFLVLCVQGHSSMGFREPLPPPPKNSVFVFTVPCKNSNSRKVMIPWLLLPGGKLCQIGYELHMLGLCVVVFALVVTHFLRCVRQMVLEEN